MTLHVSVTAEDIKVGKRGNGWDCPAVLAIRRAMTDARNAGLFMGACAGHWHDSYGRMHPWGDERVKSFINDFDAGRPVEPFEFDMEVPA